MKKILYMIWSFAAICGAIGCSDDGDELRPEANEHYTATTMLFTADRGEQVVSLNIQGDDYTVYTPTADSWITYHKADGQLKVMVQANTTAEVRESKIVVISNGIQESIPVVQDIARPMSFKTDLLVRGLGGTREFPFECTCEGPFNIEVDALSKSWLSAEINEDTGVLTLTAVGQPIGSTQRSGKVTVTATSPLGIPATFVLPVVQSAVRGDSYVFTMPDFSESRVYKVMYDGKQQAEVCMEFLTDYNSKADNVKVNMQAIVVYPIGEDGKADLAQGYVAKVIKANTGEFAYTYAAPTTPIHGGTVAWDKETNSIISYRDGVLETAPNRICIPGDDVIGHEVVENALECTVEPDLVYDNRPNDTPRVYSIVKVATQYWMRENLMAKCWVDGERIPTSSSPTERLAAKSPFALIIGKKTVDGSSKTTLFQDLWTEDPEDAEIIETRIKTTGVMYNFNCINRITVPEGQTYQEYWMNTLGHRVDLPADGDVLAPEGWMVCGRDQLVMLRNYCDEPTTYVDGSRSNPRTRRVRNLDAWPTLSYKKIFGWEDEDITGLNLVLTPRFNGVSTAGVDQLGWPSDYANVYLLTRTCIQCINGDGSGTYVPDTAGFLAFTTQNGSFYNEFYNMTRVWAVRCIRK